MKTKEVKKPKGESSFVQELLVSAKMNNPAGRSLFRERMNKLTGNSWSKGLLSTYESGRRIPRADMLSTLRVAAGIGKSRFNKLVEKWYTF